VLVQGPSAGALDAIFRADWESRAAERCPHRPGRPARRSHASRASGPDCPTDTIYEALLTAIFRADNASGCDAYFVPDDALARALEIAARRGVDVRVLVPRGSNHPLQIWPPHPASASWRGGGNVFRYLPGCCTRSRAGRRRAGHRGSANFECAAFLGL